MGMIGGLGGLFWSLGFLIYLVIVIYLLVLASRLVNAVERIADKLG